MMKYIVYMLLITLCVVSCGAEGNDNPSNNRGNPSDEGINWNAAADSSSRALVEQFWDHSAYYFWTDNHGNHNFQYWPQAHALDVLVDAYTRSKDSYYLTYINRWFEGVRRGNGNRWRNDYYDDMEWNALAMLRAFEATGDRQFKDAALELWGYIKQGWSDIAGGGIAWVSSQPWSKNACSNGPACILAARLYQLFGDESDKEWAFKIYDWEKATLFNYGNGAVLDNINGETGVKSDWVFTYNQGTFIGSAVQLHQITNEKAYLNDAVLAANYTMGSLVGNSSDAILKSEGDGDGGLFKGVFIRYFVSLIEQERLDKTDSKRYLAFLKHNAETLWNKGTYKRTVLFGPYWMTPPTGQAGLTEQLSGCMLIEAAARLDL